MAALNTGDQIDAEDEAPQLTLGGGARRDRLQELELAPREAVVPVLLDAIDRIGDGLPVELDHGRELRPGAAPRVLGVGEPVGLPPFVAPGHEAGNLRPNGVVHAGAELLRRACFDEARSPARPRVVPQGEARAPRRVEP